MPKKAKELSALEVKRLAQKPGFHPVGGVAGLHLNVSKPSVASWILRKKVGNERPDLGLGPYPAVSLAQAREKARGLEESIRAGIDPREERRAAKDALVEAQNVLTFEAAARRCHAAKEPELSNAKHRQDWISSLEIYAFPRIGDCPVADVDLPRVLEVLEPIWTEKTETAKRLRERLESVLTWATVSGHRSGENPARWAGNLKEVLPAPAKIQKTEHYKALPWKEVPTFMAALRQRQGISARALEFAVLTAARSGEVRFATWQEIDLEGRVWTVPGDRIKAGKAHRVPLSEDAVALLEALPRIEGSPYVFPAPRGGALSDMALTRVLKRMEVDATVHGFRSSFKDWARSATAYADEVSELALAHVNSDATRAAYARDELLPQRDRLMAEWARFCREGMPESAEISAIGEGRR